MNLDNKLLKTIKLNNIKFEKNNIDFTKFIKYIVSQYDNNYYQKNVLENKYDIICEKILLLPVNSKIEFFKNTNLKIVIPYSISIYYLLQNILSNIINNNSILLITNYNRFNIILEQLNKDFNICFYDNLENIINFFNNYNNNNNNYNNNNKKYNTIIIKHKEKLCENYIDTFFLLELPNLITSITMGLIQLNKNGDLFLFTRIGIVNEAFNKIIKLLFFSFNKIELFSNNNNSLYLIKCYGFKDNIEKTIIDKLIKISIESRKYHYTYCQYFNYLYHLEKQYHKKLNYKLDLNLIGKNYNSTQKTIEIIDDIDLDNNFILKKSKKKTTSTYKSKTIDKTSRVDILVLIYSIKKLYTNYFDNLHYNIMKYITEDSKGTIFINYDILNKKNYNNLLASIHFFEENKIPYNKSYLVYIDKFNKNIINQLFSYKYEIKHQLIKYRDTQSKRFQKTTIEKLNDKKVKSYSFDGFYEKQDLFELAYKVKNNLLEEIADHEVPKPIKQATEDFARGVSAYIMEHFKTQYPVSNAFCKLWEIYNSFDVLPLKANLKIFLMAEAPGQWIHCSYYYYFLNYAKKRNTPKIKYEIDWRANSLNPYNQVNLAKYGNDIFSDQYGFMKKFPQRWVWGADNTGDLLSTENQKWYSTYIREFGNGKLDLITSDAGIWSDNPLIFQKVELATLTMVIGGLSNGGNCVMKHFLSYIRKVPITYYANGFLVNYLFLYYLMFEEVNLVKPLTSNPDSGEFYVVAKGFKGGANDEITNQLHNKLLNLLDNFEVNMCFFEKDDIPDEFVKQIIEFAEKILSLNIEHNEITNLLLTCMIHKNPVIEEKTQCSKYLNKKFIQDIHNSKFKEWVKNNKFS
jgi:hypothetical protein